MSKTWREELFQACARPRGRLGWKGDTQSEALALGAGQSGPQRHTVTSVETQPCGLLRFHPLHPSGHVSFIQDSGRTKIPARFHGESAVRELPPGPVFFHLEQVGTECRGRRQ